MSIPLTTSDTPPLRVRLGRIGSAPFVLLLMAFGIWLLYQADGDIVLAPLGLACFALMALLRPDLGLLFVPITAPYFILKAWIPYVRASGFVWPMHEIVLLIVLAAALVNLAARGVLRLARTTDAYPERSRRGRRPTPDALRAIVYRPLWLTVGRGAAPFALLLVAGVVGVLIALPGGEERDAALRALRRAIIEPLIFYGLLRWYMRHDPRYALHATQSLIVSGSIVAVIALLQYAGFFNVVEIVFNQRAEFASSVVLDGEVRRVSSVYGNPNNLGLFLGRIWPLAALLALAAWRNRQRRAWLYGGGALLCLAGIIASFSRGAWLGVAAALAVLAVGLLAERRTVDREQAAEGQGDKQTRGQGDGEQATTFKHQASSIKHQASSINRPSSRIPRHRLLVAIAIAAVAALAIAAGLVVGLRGVSGGSVGVRVLLWRETLQLLQLHPFGLGLDQFYYYHNPEFGRSLIDPRLANTTDRFASHPHNGLLELWVQIGPLGVIAFGWLLLRFFGDIGGALWGARQAGTRLLALGLAAGMSAALIHGLVDSFYVWPDIIFTFWLMLAVAAQARSAMQKEQG